MATIKGRKGDDVINGTSAADRLHGAAGNDWLSGLASDDMLYGGAGDDQLSGGDGSDIVFGGAGNDTLTFDPGNDRLYGGCGNDSFLTFDDTPMARPGHDYIDGGSGSDGVGLFFGWTWAGAVIDLSSGLVTGGGEDGSGTLQLAGIENVTGSAWGDTIIGNAGDNVLRGFEGNDLIMGNGGNDTLSGDGHDDTLVGGAGDDRFEITLDPFNFPMTYGNESIDGGEGVDAIDFRGVLTGVVVDLSAGAAHSGAEDGSGSVAFVSIEDIIGSPYDDVVAGNFSDNVLRGWDGNDRLSGSDGNDILIGDSANDVLAGGAGADRFAAGIADGADTITDFATGIDELVLYPIDVFGPEGPFAMDDDRFYANAGATSGQDATDRVIYDIASGSLYTDPDGSGAAPSLLLFTLQGAPALASTDVTIQDYSMLYA